LRIFRPLREFEPDQVDVYLGTAVPPTAKLHLYSVKTAEVLSGECAPSAGTCTLTMATGETCQGDYVQENQGTTTTETTTRDVAGGAIGATGNGIAGGSFAVRNSAMTGGKQSENMNKAVAVLRCAGNVIDCGL